MLGVTVKLAVAPEHMVWPLTVAEEREFTLSVPAAEVMALQPFADTRQLYWLLSATPEDTV